MLTNLEKIMDNLGDLLWEGKDDALEVTIKEVKNYIIKTWPNMAGADVGTVMSSIREPSCIGLHESLQSEGVQVSDPEEDKISALEVTRGLPQQRNERDVMVHCITLFHHLSESTGHISAAMANLAALAKIMTMRHS